MANDKLCIETSKTCEHYGADQVLICGIITRKRGYMERRRIELNNLLKDMCYDSGYIYIDNDNIGHDHLYEDGVHLNHEGSNILAGNLLHSLHNLF